MPRLEAEIYNITSEQPVFQRAREANFTSVGNFWAIIPGRPLVRRNNWMERNTHLMWLWEQTQILALETSAWLSFGWNVTGNWGWLWLMILFWLKAGCFPDSFDGMAQVINDLLIQINSDFFFLCLCPNKSGLMSVPRCFYQRWRKQHRAWLEWGVFLQRELVEFMLRIRKHQ